MLTTENINDTAGDFVPGVIPANFADLHWSQRRKLVEINGSTWTNAEDAHAFLTGLLTAQKPADTDKAEETLPESTPPASGGQPEPGPESTTPMSDKTQPVTQAVASAPFKFDIKRGYAHHVTDNSQWYEQDGYKFGTNGLYIGKA